MSDDLPALLLPNTSVMGASGTTWRSPNALKFAMVNSLSNLNPSTLPATVRILARQLGLR